MKIAGRKNDGAWFRLNRELKNIRQGAHPEEIYDLSSLLSAEPTCDLAFEAILALQIACGITPPVSPATGSAWIVRLVEVGIPRQVYMGRLSFTTYTRTGSPGDYEYAPEHQAVFHSFGKRLRYIAKIWLHGRRQMHDLNAIGLATEGNPGGQADATPNN